MAGTSRHLRLGPQLLLRRADAKREAVQRARAVEEEWMVEHVASLRATLRPRSAPPASERFSWYSDSVLLHRGPAELRLLCTRLLPCIAGREDGHGLLHACWPSSLIVRGQELDDRLNIRLLRCVHRRHVVHAEQFP